MRKIYFLQLPVISEFIIETILLVQKSEINKFKPTKFSKSKSVDTTNIKFIANDKININIFLSYAAPKINIIKIIFTNLLRNERW